MYKFNYSYSFEETVSYKKNEPHKSLNFNKPYKLSENSFDKYVKQNKCEFNQEYAKCKNNTKIPSKFNEAKEPSNNKWKQISYNITANKIIPLHIIENLDQTPNKIKQFINGYCFIKLRKGICHRHMCNFNHDVSINIIYLYLFIMLLFFLIILCSYVVF